MGFFQYMGLMALLIAGAIALISSPSWFPKIVAKFREPDFIEVARDVTYEVIEASLRDRPFDWKLARPEGNPVGKAFWATNYSAGIALWLRHEATGLYILAKNGEEKFDSEKKITPSLEWRQRLWRTAKTLIDAEDEAKETEFLKGMVAGFSRLSEARRNK